MQYRASTIVEGCQASRLGHLLQYMHVYKAESPKQGRKRFNSIVKRIGFDHLVIIYLWSLWKMSGFVSRMAASASSRLKAM